MGIRTRIQKRKISFPTQPYSHTGLSTPPNATELCFLPRTCITQLKELVLRVLNTF